MHFFHNKKLIGYASFFGFGFPYPVFSLRQATQLSAKQYFYAFAEIQSDFARCKKEPEGSFQIKGRED